MRRMLLLLGVLVLTAPQLVYAQHFRGLQIYGGYSYLRDDASSTPSPFFLTPIPFGSNFGLNGWQASITEDATDWLGMTQQFGGSYGTRRLQGVDNHFSTFSILSGPQFSVPNLRVITPFAHALFGYDQTTVSIPGTSYSARSQSYAMAVGGGLDVKIVGPFAVRLFEADYYRNSVFGYSQNNLRFSGGIVLRFGK